MNRKIKIDVVKGFDGNTASPVYEITLFKGLRLYRGNTFKFDPANKTLEVIY